MTIFAPTPEANTSDASNVLGIPAIRMPKHVAIIMDGNGRWAKNRALHRSFGHIRGTSRVKEIIREADRIGIKYLTLYAFSTENWSRPQEEISVLMDLLQDYLIQERQELIDNNIQMRAIGQIERLPTNVQATLRETIELTSKNTGMVLNFCISYGGRAELVRAIQAIARDVSEGKMSIADIDEKQVSARLYTGDIPDPDLVIRTSGEFRISNFLIWQLAYSEFYITETLWPDFEPSHLRAACEAYSQRKRRFGQTDEIRPRT